MEEPPKTETTESKGLLSGIKDLANTVLEHAKEAVETVKDYVTVPAPHDRATEENLPQKERSSETQTREISGQPKETFIPSQPTSDLLEKNKSSLLDTETKVDVNKPVPGDLKTEMREISNDLIDKVKGMVTGKEERLSEQHRVDAQPSRKTSPTEPTEKKPETTETENLTPFYDENADYARDTKQRMVELGQEPKETVVDFDQLLKQATAEQFCQNLTNKP